MAQMNRCERCKAPNADTILTETIQGQFIGNVYLCANCANKFVDWLDEPEMEKILIEQAKGKKQ